MRLLKVGFIVPMCAALMHCTDPDEPREAAREAAAPSAREGNLAQVEPGSSRGAAPPQRRPSAAAAMEPLFLEVDSDENGRITPEEARSLPWLARNFTAFDNDDSGELDVQEYSNARADRPPQDADPDADASRESADVPQDDADGPRN